jgi:hypothetical protein
MKHPPRKYNSAQAAAALGCTVRHLTQYLCPRASIVKDPQWGIYVFGESDLARLRELRQTSLRGKPRDKGTP